MPSLTILYSGVTAAKRSEAKATNALRGSCVGWSEKAAKRCEKFLQSVDYDEISSQGLAGYALTLTLASRPETHLRWINMLDRLRKRWERMGMVLCHFVTEWQPREGSPFGPCPHLHCIVFFRKDDRLLWTNGFNSALGTDALLIHWLEIADPYDPLLVSQHAEPVYDVKGWFKYLSKHASRGAQHYQRAPEKLPAGWTRTGRMWGKWGTWPVRSLRVEVSDSVFYGLRRFVRRYQLASVRADLRRTEARLVDARNFGQVIEARRHLTSLKKRRRFLQQALTRSEEKIARLVPVSEWVPSPIILVWLKHNTVHVECVDQQTGEVFQFHRLHEEGVGSTSDGSAP